VALVDKMRLKYAIGLISNTNEAHVRWITEKFGFLNWFPKPTYSFIAGYLKPQKEIYIEALRAMSVTAGKSLFVDDLKGNVSAALKLGMSAIHLTPDKDLEHEIRNFGLKGF
jgi:putative hydrolase of the HAD superfamily